MMENYQAIQFEITDGVAALTLNRPDQLNAISNRMLEEIAEAVGRLESEGARALLLTGAGRAFCSGADLSEMSNIPPEERDAGIRLEKWLNPLLERLRTLPMPVVAAVNGPAVGAGSGLALAADIVLAARSAFFLLPFARIGFVPDVGSTWLLPRLVGKARAMGMMLLGDKISAEQAQDWGLIWKSVADEELMQAATDRVRTLAAGPTLAYARMRAAVAQGLESDFSDSIALERRNQAECGRTHDHLEGVAAFREKRRPSFKGQ